MKPYIKRGDIVLVKKIKQEKMKDICVGDIIEYSIENKVIKIDKINIFNVSFCIHFREKRHVKIYLHSLVFVIL